MIEAAIAFLAGAAGLLAVYHRLRQEFSIAAAVLTTLLLFAGTSLFWSMTRSASPADAIVFAAVAGLGRIAHGTTPRLTRLLAWGLLTALPILAMWASRAMDGGSRLGLLAGDPLFSPTRGFFSLTPVAYIAALGMFLYFRRDRRLALASMAVGLTWVFTSSLLASHARQPFDQGLTAALALVAPGLASVLELARAKPLLAAVPLVAIFPLWNYWLMVQYTTGMLPKDEPVSFAAMVRQQAEVHTRSPYFYPFAFPANVFFAWREGVPVDRYELLAREPRLAQFELTMDREAGRFLIDGWGSAASTPSGALHWTTSRQASVVFPLQPPSSDVAIELVAAARAEDPAVAVEFSVEVNGHEVGRASALPDPVNARFTLPAATIRRVLRDGYNRLIIVHHGIRRINAEDQRALGPLAARSAAVAFPLGVYSIRIGPAS